MIEKKTEFLNGGETLLREVARRGTGCLKWDELDQRFGDPELIAMWVADMDFSAPQVVLDALQERVAHGAFGYQDAPLGWKQSFSEWEQRRYRVKVAPDWIRYVPGVVPAIYRLIRLLTQPGDACLIQTPVYYPFHHAVRDTERTLVCHDLCNENGVYRVDLDRFEKDVIRHQVKIFILCSPHNPVGRVWTREELSGMCEVCHRHGVIVLSDEIHQDLVAPPFHHIPTALVAKDVSRLITLTSASKTFNLASLENAMIILPDEGLRKQYDQFIRTHQPGDGNVLGFVAVEAAYRHGQPWLDALMMTLRENEAIVRRILGNTYPQWTISPLEGTYLLWIDLRASMEEAELVAFMQQECGVAADYGSWFGKSGEGFVRLNLATPEHRVTDVAERMVAAGRRRGF